MNPELEWMASVFTVFASLIGTGSEILRTWRHPGRATSSPWLPACWMLACGTWSAAALSARPTNVAVFVCNSVSAGMMSLLLFLILWRRRGQQPD